jgi:hypothetical protein
MALFLLQFTKLWTENMNEIITLPDLEVEGRIIQLPGTFCGHFKIEKREGTGTFYR